jgi:hypothetical protein
MREKTCGALVIAPSDGFNYGEAQERTIVVMGILDGRMSVYLPF